jgi:hypothetical protein
MINLLWEANHMTIYSINPHSGVRNYLFQTPSPEHAQHIVDLHNLDVIQQQQLMTENDHA